MESIAKQILHEFLESPVIIFICKVLIGALAAKVSELKSPPCTWEGNGDSLKKISFRLYTKSSTFAYSFHIKIAILTILLINNNGKHSDGICQIPDLCQTCSQWNASKEVWHDWKWTSGGFPKRRKGLYCFKIKVKEKFAGSKRFGASVVSFTLIWVNRKTKQTSKHTSWPFILNWRNKR